MTKFSDTIPLARDSAVDKPRSWWDKQVLAKATVRPRKAMPMSGAGKLPQPDPNTPFRLTSMKPALSMMSDRSEQRNWPDGYQIEGATLVYRPSREQKDFLKSQMESRGMPSGQIEDLKFVEGLDADAGFITRSSYPRADAITQGNSVYVKPEKFQEVAGFRSPTTMEEVYHSGQFESDGGAGFYRPYLLGTVGGWLSKADSYNGNHYEAFAKGAANEMYDAYRNRKAGRRR